MTANSPRTSALDLIRTVVDPGSWRCWDEPVEVTTTDPAYRADLLAARGRTGLDESVVTGEGRIAGRRVALMACEFRFLAGSIGVAAGERLVRAVERATAERLPLLAAPASGGTRMQEGTVAFLQMVKVAAAITDHKAAGLPYLVYLRHPTTGGVLASWGSLGHLTAAEPGALIGFLGPRVHQALYGEEFPQGVQVAENLEANGLVDAVLPAARLSEVAARALTVLAGVAAPATTDAGRAGPVAASAPAAGGDSVTGGGSATGEPGAAAPEPPSSTASAEAGGDFVAPGGGAVAGDAGSGVAESGFADEGGPVVPGPALAVGRAGAGGSGPAVGDAGFADGGGPVVPGPVPAGGGAGAGDVGPVAGEAGPPAVAAESGSVGGGGATAPESAFAAGEAGWLALGGVGVAGTAESIRRSRLPGRPGVRELLAAAATEVTPLSGTAAGERDPGLLLALARVGGTPCVVLGHDRRGHAVPGTGQALGPAGLRAARRGMRIAAELDLPLLTVIDTAGAALSRDAEEGGLAGEIARCLADLVTLPAPTLCLLLGQGAGGAALALLPADRVVAARHAWLSPLPPEGASAILYRTTERAYEVADRQGVRSADLLANGIVDVVVEEDQEEGPDDDFLPRLGTVLGAELAGLAARDQKERLSGRRARYRRIGLPG
ncbi:carboxyl transferase domain-containing protein [Streptomyces sp. NPDC002537]